MKILYILFLTIVISFSALGQSAPTVSFVNPNPSSNFDIPVFLQLEANASDPDGTITKVEYFEGDKLIGEATTPPYEVYYSIWAPGKYSITAKATDNDGNSTITPPYVLNITNKYRVEYNIAKGQPAFSSSNESNALTPNYAVDGDTTTRWSSAFSDPQWLVVDLGATYDIKTIDIKWETAYGKSYEIQVSNDTVNWRTIYVTNNNTSLHNIITDTLNTFDRPGRYIRLLGTQRGTGWGYSIYEFKVYGNHINPRPPVISLYSEENKALTFYVEGYDPDGTIEKVEYFIGNVKIGDGVEHSPEFFTLGYSFSAPGTYIITAVATDNSGLKTSVNYTYTYSFRPQTSPVNLALNRPAFSSSNESNLLTPDKAVDGNYTTRWSSAFSDPQWIYVDLGASYLLKTVYIRWETAYGRNFQIQVSDDAANWSDIINITNNNSLTLDTTHPDGVFAPGRYVRVYGTERGTGWGYSIYEIVLYGNYYTPANSTARMGAANSSDGTANATENQLILFPNPAVNSFTLSFDNPAAQNAVLKIQDQFSREVYSTSSAFNSGQGSIQVDVQGWAEGIYFATLQYGSTIKSQKFVVKK